MSERIPIGDTLIVDCGNALGPHDVLDSYVETFWLPALGPGSICVARRLTRLLIRYGGNPIQIDVRRLGLEIGLPGGRNGGRPVHVVRCLQRLASFGLAVHDEHRYWLSMFWPLLPQRLADRLPEPLRSQARPPERAAANVTRSPLAS